MFGYPNLNGGFNIIKILNGVSRTLSIANKVIPMYKKAIPMVNNAKNIIGTLKSINIVDKKTENNENISIKKEEINQVSHTNNPVFFI